MKPRRVMIMIEATTEAPLEVIRDADGWGNITVNDDDGEEHVVSVEQVQVNVIREPKAAKRKGTR